MTDGKKPETPITDAAKQWIDLEGEQVCLVDFLVAERLEADLIAAQKELTKADKQAQHLLNEQVVMVRQQMDRAVKAEEALADAQKELTAAGARTWSANKRADCAEQVLALRGEPVAITAEQENAAMDVARQEYGHGVTRASIWAIYKAIVNAPLYAAPISGERVREAIPNGMALVPKILPLDIALDFMADTERADYEKPGNTSVASMVRIIATWEKLLALPLAAIQGEQE